MNDSRWASINAFAEENRDNILRDITRLVAVPSVEGEAAQCPVRPRPQGRAGQGTGNCRGAGPFHLQCRQLHRLG